MKNIIIVIVVLILVGGGILVWQNLGQPQEVLVPEEKPEQEAKETEVSFSQDVLYGVCGSQVIPEKMREEICQMIEPYDPLVQEIDLMVVWLIENQGNIVEDVKITTELPDWLQYSGETFPSGAGFNFDNESRIVTLEVGNIPLNLQLTAFAFKTKLELEDQPMVGDILFNSVLTGKDTGTGEKISVEVLAIPTTRVQ